MANGLRESTGTGFEDTGCRNQKAPEKEKPATTLSLEFRFRAGIMAQCFLLVCYENRTTSARLALLSQRKNDHQNE
jgi:hypothetical protein